MTITTAAITRQATKETTPMKSQLMDSMILILNSPQDTVGGTEIYRAVLSSSVTVISQIADFIRLDVRIGHPPYSLLVTGLYNGRQVTRTEGVILY
jgi:hypothetical protein